MPSTDANNQENFNCDEAIARLYTFLDGELTDDRRAKIDHHLAECHHCVEAYEFELELRTIIRMRCQDKVPETLRRRVFDALRNIEN